MNCQCRGCILRVNCGIKWQLRLEATFHSRWAPVQVKVFFSTATLGHIHLKVPTSFKCPASFHEKNRLIFLRQIPENRGEIFPRSRLRRASAFASSPPSVAFPSRARKIKSNVDTELHSAAASLGTENGGRRGQKRESQRSLFVVLLKRSGSSRGEREFFSITAREEKVSD